jgi:phosphoserine aminotransferase
MLTLPNRYLVNIATGNDYFRTYHYPLGVIRITVGQAWGFAEEAKGSAKKLFSKLTRAAPDTFAKVEVGAEEAWQTSTKNNTVHPKWNETHGGSIDDFSGIISCAFKTWTD